MHSERLLWPTKAPGKFETEVDNLEQDVGLTTLAESCRLGADEVDVA